MITPRKSEKKKKTERRQNMFQGERKGASKKVASTRSESKRESRMMECNGLVKSRYLFTLGTGT